MRMRHLLAATLTAAMILGLGIAAAGPASATVTCPVLSGSSPYIVTPAPSPGVNWSGCNLARANLFGANMTGVNLNGANIGYADLRGANLTGANLTGADAGSSQLDSANLTGANLTNTFWFGANLTGANLSGANLLDAYLGFSTLTGVNLTGANLTGANLTGAFLFSGILTDANLSGANLNVTNLGNSILRGANLSLTILTGSILTDADFADVFVSCGAGGELGSAIQNAPLNLPPGWSFSNSTLTAPIVNCPVRPIWHQAIGRASAEATCPDGYGASWALWPNGGTGGYVCNRDVYAD